MTPEFISQLLEKSLSVAILVVGGYFMIRYFMQEIQRKDAQNQANLDRFISLVEKTNHMMESFRTELGWYWVKLQEVHDEVKSLKNKR